MKVSLLRKISISITTLMASSTAFAGMDIDSRVTQLENQMQQVRTETAMGTYGAQTATARAEVDGYGWFFTTDILYWRARVGGTEFAYTNNTQTTKVPLKGTIKNIDFDWNWGLRVGAGYNFDHDGWDFRLGYTLFHNSGNSSANAGLHGIVIPLKGSERITVLLDQVPQNVFVFSKSAKAQYDFNYEGIDVNIGRAYYMSSKVSHRPHWGLKTTWIDQEQIVRYTGGDQIAEDGEMLGLGDDTVQVKEDCNFWGLGPRLGIDSKWYLGYGISAFGDIAGALVFGQFDLGYQELYTRKLPETSIKLNGHRHAFSPNMQMRLGLRYDAYLHDNKQHIGVGVGFEANYWWRQNQMLIMSESFSVKSTKISEDVSMHGLTVDFKWDF